jgi:hypothetical protein
VDQELATVVGWIEGNTTIIALLEGIFNVLANCAPTTWCYQMGLHLPNI